MGTMFSSSEEEEEEGEEELEQEPEVSPFEHSSSSLSPQISMSRSPFFGPSMRNSDPYNAGMTPVSLSPTSASAAPAMSHLSRFHNVMSTAISPGHFLPSWLLAAEEFHIEVYLIRHGQSTSNIKPELIGGRSPSAVLTETGRHESRALGAFLKSTGVVFDAVYSSPLERAKQTAEVVCEVLGIPEEQIEFVEALQELGQGQWEGRLRTEVYTREIVQLMNNTVPDFRAPGGESQRQLEFRMVEFLNNILLPHAAIALQEEAKGDKDKGTVRPNLAMPIHPLKEPEIVAVDDTKSLVSSKSAGKEIVELEHPSATNGDDNHHPEDALLDHFSKRNRLPRISVRREPETLQRKGPYCVAVFSHAMAIKCALRGLLGSDPHRTKICVDNTSVTVLKHSGSTGWQIQRVNDTAHLRLL
ncbi:unnamed protein product [Calypogeia fissa]